jgi:prepilin-type N-terminal cleavage/methylation domain-containing protein
MIPSGNRNRNGRQSGFSLLEVLMAILLLAISFVGLTAYSGTQRKALGKSSDWTEAGNSAVTILEKTKIPLSDSAAFKKKFDALSSPQAVTTSFKGKKINYTVVTTLSRVPSSDNMIKAKVKLTWTGHSYNLGMVLVQP